MNKKGQSSMEYLMTYGWAILIIAIIFAILFIYIRPFQTPENCMSKSSTFTCEGQRISSGNLYVKISNTLYKPIKISGIACVPVGSVQNQITYTPIGEEEVPSGGYIRKLWESSDVKCTNAKAGTPYAGIIYIKYKEVDAPEGVPEKIAEITFSTTPS